MKPSAIISLAAMLTAATFHNPTLEDLSVQVARTLRVAGCYSGISRGLDRQSVKIEKNSALACVTSCVQFDDSAVVAINGDFCRCGTNILPPAWARVDDLRCDIKCPGKVDVPKVEGFDDGGFSCGGEISVRGLWVVTYWTILTSEFVAEFLGTEIVEGDDAYDKRGFKILPPSDNDSATFKGKIAQHHPEL